MASAAEGSEICEEDEENTAVNGIRRSSSDSKIKKLRRRISQGLRFSFLKDESGGIDILPEHGNLQLENDIFEHNHASSPVSKKVIGKRSVRRTSSDSVGARLRKISFEIGNGRRHSDEFASEGLSKPMSHPFGCLDSY